MKTQKNQYKKIIAILVGMAMVLSGFIIIPSLEEAGAQLGARTYTTDADFDEGTLNGVEHTTIPDQLQLTQTPVSLPFIWVTNSSLPDGSTTPKSGTVSKIDTSTGNELASYRVGPVNTADPSRTAVDLNYNVWIANRRLGTVVKIGLLEMDQCADRNNNGTIETSRDLNGNGDILGAEILPWGQDECVLYEVVLAEGKPGATRGTYIPGTYTGTYDSEFWGTAPRGIAVDRNNNLWAGVYNRWPNNIAGTGMGKYFYIKGDTGEIVDMNPSPTEVAIDVSPWSHNSYGAVIDQFGHLWSSGHQNNHVLKIELDYSTDPPTVTNKFSIPLGYFAYGLALDFADHLFVTNWTDNRVTRINILNNTIEWQSPLPGLNYSRGIAASADNNIWVVNSVAAGTITRYDNNGNLIATISVGNRPTGVAVSPMPDGSEKIWAVNWGDEYVKRIDPITNTIDLSKRITGGYHYNYSDMTGYVSGSITTKTGRWTVTYDSGAANTTWGRISWNSSEPPNTSITVKVRSSEDQISWSSWENAPNYAVTNQALSLTPNGRYLQIEATFRITAGNDSPILYDLTVQPIVTGAVAEDWAWSENIGWISFSSTNCDANDDGVSDGTPPGCPPAGTPMENYQVRIDALTGDFSGYAWSEHIGWISFDRARTGNPPGPPFQAGPGPIAKLDLDGTVCGGINRICGWARALSACQDNLWDNINKRCIGSGAGNAAGGWDGWIKSRKDPADGGADYGVWVDFGPIPAEFRGWAWGDTVIGWISFNRINCDPDKDGITEGGANNPDFPNCPAGENISDYKVILTLILNYPPDPPSSLTVDWNHCLFKGYSIPTFHWNFSDPDGDEQEAYEIWIGDAGDPQVLSPIFTYLADPSGSLSFAPTPAQLTWMNFGGITYYWKVRVRDDRGGWSDWSNPASFTTPPHAYPWPEFTPLPPNPSLNEVVKFVQNNPTLAEAICYNASNNEYRCENINPITGSYNRYQWDFSYDSVAGFTIDCDSNTYPLCRGNATTTYSSRGTYKVRLRITDPSLPLPDNYCTCPEKVIDVGFLLPKWKEVSPVSWLKKSLASLSYFFERVLVSEI